MGNKAKIAKLKKQVKKLSGQVDRLGSSGGAKSTPAASPTGATKPAPAPRRTPPRRKPVPSAGQQPQS